jgi:hypothetical protein
VAKRIGVRVDFDAISKILNSSEMATVLKSLADSIAQTAGSGYEVEVAESRRKSRIISMVKDVSPNGLGREIATGNLARAVSAKEEPWT